MADETVTPSTLLLALEQQTSGYSFVIFPSTFQLEGLVPSFRVSCSFPTLARKPSHTFSDEKSSEAVSTASAASGYPVLVKQFTFDPRTFTPVFHLLPEADKLMIMAFYENYKDVPFPWYNDQDDTWYEVCFVSKPKCRIEGRVDLWRVDLTFIQNSPTV